MKNKSDANSIPDWARSDEFLKVYPTTAAREAIKLLQLFNEFNSYRLKLYRQGNRCSFPDYYNHERQVIIDFLINQR